jgi:hypothetical protein
MVDEHIRGFITNQEGAAIKTNLQWEALLCSRPVTRNRPLCVESLLYLQLVESSR